MDPIKNMISGSDPLHSDPAAVPDADAALRRVTTRAPMFTDSLPANVLRWFEDRKRRRARVAGVLTLAAAAVTAGVLVATNLGALTTAPEPASTCRPRDSVKHFDADANSESHADGHAHAHSDAFSVRNVDAEGRCWQRGMHQGKCHRRRKTLSKGYGRYSDLRMFRRPDGNHCPRGK